MVWKTTIVELIRFYEERREDIEDRLEEFKALYARGTDEDIFAELVFCILTPQSKANYCWTSVEGLRDKDLLLNGTASKVSKELDRVRFRNNKSRYIVGARKVFLEGDVLVMKRRIDGFNDPYEAREWFVTNVKGIGYKEASHFLRNIGKGFELAILDRHVLGNLADLGILDEVPTSLTKNRYLEIEALMRDLSEKVEIPMAHLDLLLWCKETGEIFK